jgi:hypothetical protein
MSEIKGPIEETIRYGLCVVCHDSDQCIVLAGELLCGRCDARGRIAAARVAFDDKAYTDGVKKGYEQRG